MVWLTTARPVAGGFPRLLSIIFALSIVALAPVVPATNAFAQLLTFPAKPEQTRQPRLRPRRPLRGR